LDHKIVVLVVEDEVLIRLDIVDYLNRQGFEVLEAEGADEAIEILVARPEVEILFTDIDMPRGVDGLKLAAAVRDRWPPIKIVVTSGHRTVTADQLPVDARFFSKPSARPCQAPFGS
jgi:DNA-binding NtrC family response regulator